MRPVVVDATDSLASFLALAYIARTFDIRGVSAAQGADPNRVTGMCRALALDCPVVAGAQRPILGQACLPDRGILGEHALRIEPFPPLAPDPGYAWDLMHRQAQKAEGSLEIITLGSLTNLAIAIARYPGLGGLLKGITLYAGARLGGNVPAAPQSEWHMYMDPDAAYMVMALPVDKLVVDLNTALMLSFPPQTVQSLFGAAAGGRPVPELAPLSGEQCLPELACAALAQSLEEASDVRALAATVETDSALARGRLVIEYDTLGKGETPCCRLIFAHDARRLGERIKSTLA